MSYICYTGILTPPLDSYLEVFAPKTWLNVCPDVFMGGAGYCAEYCTSRYSLSLGTLGSSNAYFLVTRCGRRRKTEERKEGGKEREGWKEEERRQERREGRRGDRGGEKGVYDSNTNKCRPAIRWSPLK